MHRVLIMNIAFKVASTENTSGHAIPHSDLLVEAGDMITGFLVSRGFEASYAILDRKNSGTYPVLDILFEGSENCPKITADAKKEMMAQCSEHPYLPGIKFEDIVVPVRVDNRHYGLRFVAGQSLIRDYAEQLTACAKPTMQVAPSP